MKNLQELKFRSKEIDKEMSTLLKPHIKPDEYEAQLRVYKKLKKEQDTIKFCITYLSTNPKEESVLRQLNDELRKLEITDARFETWLVNEGYKKINECAKEVVSKKRAEYNSMMGVADMKRKIKMLQFLEPQQQISI